MRGRARGAKASDVGTHARRSVSIVYLMSHSRRSYSLSLAAFACPIALLLKAHLFTGFNGDQRAGWCVLREDTPALCHDLLRRLCARKKRRTRSRWKHDAFNPPVRGLRNGGQAELGSRPISQGSLPAGENHGCACQERPQRDSGGVVAAVEGHGCC